MFPAPRFPCLVVCSFLGAGLFSAKIAAAELSPPAQPKSIAVPAKMRVDAAGKNLQPFRARVGGKDYDFAELLKLKPADTMGVEVLTVVPFCFKHAGMLNDLKQLNFIKQKIAEGKEPWASAFERLKKSAAARLNYLEKMKEPPAVIKCDFSGANNVGALEEMRDASAAYAQALMWYFTGDRAYATNAAGILETYAKTVTSHEGKNWYLLAAWPGSVFPVAADLLRATDPQWHSAPVIAKWFNDVFLPQLHDRIGWGNRGLAVMNAMAAIGVFNEDTAAFYEALNHWVNYVPAYYYLSEDGATPRLPDYWIPEITPSDEFLLMLDAPTFPKDWTPWIQLAAENWNLNKRRGKFGDDVTGMRKTAQEQMDPAAGWKGAPGTYLSGYTAETGRDLNHVDQAFASTMNLAEIAWHQGIDLYSPTAKRFAAFMEAHATLRLGESPPAAVTIELTAWGMAPVFEIAYDRYHNVMGIDLPNTRKLLESVFWPAKGELVYPMVRGDKGRDPENPRLWKYAAPFPPLFATSIQTDSGWLANWQTLTHHDLHASGESERSN
ncbi:hypothetical protein BH09VER1_BH09VER1_43110 [soil metagenome]